MARKRIGTLLEERGLINEFQLVAALSHQRKWKGKIGKSLMELGYLDEQKLYEVLAEQLGVPLVDLKSRQIPPEILGKISRKEAEALHAVPIEDRAGTLVFAVADSEMPDLQVKLAKITGKPVSIVLGLESVIENWASRVPEKFPVASVQPIKKAFVRNHLGEIQPAETELPPPAPLDDDAPVPVDEGEDIFLDKGEAAPPPPTPAPVAPIPDPPPAPPQPAPRSATAPDLLDLELPPPSSFQTRTEDGPLEIPDLDLTPRAKAPAGQPPAPPPPAPDKPDDLWAMPEAAESKPAPELETLPLPSLDSVELPPPPSLDLSDLPPAPGPAPSFETPPAPPVEPIAPPQVPELDLSPPQEIPAPEKKSEEFKVPDLIPPPLAPEPAPPLAPAADKPETLFTPAIKLEPPTLEPDLPLPIEKLPPAFPPDEPEEDLSAPIPLEPFEPASPPLAPAEDESPIPLEGRDEPSSEPHVPMEDLVTEEVKAEAMAFQEEIHKAHHLMPEPELEVAPHDLLERRLAKLEIEFQKLRETVEDLIIKTRR